MREAQGLRRKCSTISLVAFHAAITIIPNGALNMIRQTDCNRGWDLVAYLPYQNHFRHPDVAVTSVQGWQMNTGDVLSLEKHLEDKKIIPWHLSGIEDLCLGPGILPKVSECFRAVTCFEIYLRTSRRIGKIKALLGCTFYLVIVYFCHYHNSGKWRLLRTCCFVLLNLSSPLQDRLYLKTLGNRKTALTKMHLQWFVFSPETPPSLILYYSLHSCI